MQESFTVTKRSLTTALTDLSAQQRLVSWHISEREKSTYTMFVFKVHKQQRAQNNRFCQLCEQRESKHNEDVLVMEEKQQTFVERICQTHDAQKLFNESLIEILKGLECRQSEQSQIEWSCFAYVQPLNVWSRTRYLLRSSSRRRTTRSQSFLCKFVQCPYYQSRSCFDKPLAHFRA